jgi:hypothetical protein
MGDGAPGPACTDSISLTRSLSGNEVIIPVIGLKIGVNPKRSRVTSIVVVVISCKPSRANNELSASKVPGTRYSWARCRFGAFARLKKGTTGRGLVRLRFDQRRKRAGPILSGSSRAITPTWGRVLCTLNLKCSGALLLQLPRQMPVRSVLGNICLGVRGNVYCGPSQGRTERLLTQITLGPSSAAACRREGACIHRKRNRGTKPAEEFDSMWLLAW